MKNFWNTLRKNAWYYATLAALAGLILAVTIMRHDESGASGLTGIATALFLAGITIGPSLLSKEVFTRLAPVERNRRLCRLLRRHIARDVKKCKEAEGRIAQRAMHCAWWDEQSKMLHAAYRLAFVENGGTFPGENPYLRQP